MNTNELPHDDDGFEQPPARGRDAGDYPPVPLMPFVDQARRRRGAILSGVALVVFVLFGTVVYASYVDNQGTATDGEPPLVTASADPIKVEPEDRGGAVAPDQDSTIHTALLGGQENAQPPQLSPEPPRVQEPSRIDTGPALNRISRDEPEAQPEAQPERAEAPVPAPEAETDAGRELLMTEAQPAAQPRPIWPRPSDTAAAPQSSTGGSTIEQAPVERLESDEPPAAPPVSAARAPAPAPQREQLVAAPTPQPRPSAAPAAVPQRQPALAPEPQDEPEPLVMAAAQPPAAQPPAAPRQSAAAPAAGGSFRIQLAAVAAGNGERGWSELQRDHGDVLGTLTPTFEEVSGRNGPIIRVQAGPFADKDSADQACEIMKQRDANCFVVGG